MPQMKVDPSSSDVTASTQYALFGSGEKLGYVVVTLNAAIVEDGEGLKELPQRFVGEATGSYNPDGESASIHVSEVTYTQLQRWMINQPGFLISLVLAQGTSRQVQNVQFSAL